MQRLSINDLAAMILTIDESQHFALTPAIRKRLRKFYDEADKIQSEYRATMKGGSKNRYVDFYLQSALPQSANAEKLQPTNDR